MSGISMGRAWTGAVALAVTLIASPGSLAHCDTMDGPVVLAARTALERGEVTPVLMWVAQDREPAIRAAFAKAMLVRGTGPEARELADLYFFETVVRVHREGEGAPYSGLRPAGTDPGAAVRQADAALEGGTVDPLLRLITDRVSSGLRARFHRALEAKKRAGEDVQAGRAFVAAYVDLMHYAERVFDQAGRSEAHGHGAAEEHVH